MYTVYERETADS